MSEDEANRRRDTETKREEYSRAEIGEYWIVAPHTATITVLSSRDGDTYAQECVFAAGEAATSQALAGFRVPVAEALAAAEKP